MIGKKARHVSKAQAFDAIFGYTIMLDVTARGYGLSKNLSGTRNVRKGFETFAPIGPWITTKDEIADPHNLWMKLWINGELKQSAKTDAMINDIATQISFLSRSHDLITGRFDHDGQSGLAGIPRKAQAGRCFEGRDRRHRRDEPRRGAAAIKLSPIKRLWYASLRFAGFSTTKKKFEILPKSSRRPMT